MKTDFGLSAYCHGNADFANVCERCWPTTMIQRGYLPFVITVNIVVVVVKINNKQPQAIHLQV